MLGDVIYTLLSRLEAVLAKPTLPREFGLRTHDASLFVLVAVHAWMNVSKMLGKVIFAKARLDVVDALAGAKAADPGFAGVPDGSY